VNRLYDEIDELNAENENTMLKELLTAGPLLITKDDRIKDLLMANNCCGERSLLLDANV
jgi:hypothetical protein